MCLCRLVLFNLNNFKTFEYPNIHSFEIEISKLTYLTLLQVEMKSEALLKEHEVRLRHCVYNIYNIYHIYDI